ncbi:MAG: sensor histidine kinase [Rickettsiales bacterium]
MRSTNLTRQLFLRIAPTVLAAILVVGVLAYRSATNQINHVYDAQLISSANMLWLVVEDDLRDSDRRGFRKIRKIDLNVSNQKALNRFASDYVDSRMFRVHRAGRLVMLTDKAPGPEVSQQKPGFTNIEAGGERWRIYNLPIPGTLIAVEAGEKIALRQSLVANILIDLALPLLLLVPVIAALIWYGIGAGLNTLRSLIEQIQLRSADDLSHLTLDDVPQDLKPLGSSINQLLTTIAHSFTAEKRFTEHAAHHLRTPLATLKLQVQLLEQARDAKERKLLLSNLLTSIERASQLVGQLLTSARVSHQKITRTALSLPTITTNVLGELAPLIREKNLTVSLDAPDDATIMGDETLLRLMVYNLIENAVKYTPERGRVTVSITTQGAQHCWVIRDSGPGIPEAERALVFERFYRVGTPKAVGTGLGLAIVAEIVTRLAGQITLRTPESGVGLEVEILLPIAA